MRRPGTGAGRCGGTERRRSDVVAAGDASGPPLRIGRRRAAPHSPSSGLPRFEKSGWSGWIRCGRNGVGIPPAAVAGPAEGVMRPRIAALRSDGVRGHGRPPSSGDCDRWAELPETGGTSAAFAGEPTISAAITAAGTGSGLAAPSVWRVRQEVHADGAGCLMGDVRSTASIGGRRRGRWMGRAWEFRACQVGAWTDPACPVRAIVLIPTYPMWFKC